VDRGIEKLLTDRQAVKRSVELVRQLGLHNAKRAELATKTAEIDEKATGIAAQLNAARTAGSKAAPDLEAKLQRTVWQRETLETDYDRQRTKILTELEEITRAPLAAVLRMYRGWFQIVQDAREHDPPEVVYRGGPDRTVALLSSNEDVVREARAFVRNCLQQLHSMNWWSLPQIQQAIDRADREFAGFDFSRRLTQETTVEVARDFGSKPATGPQDQGVIMGGPASSGNWTLVRPERPQ
jgi:hypothetical protein